MIRDLLGSKKFGVAVLTTAFMMWFHITHPHIEPQETLAMVSGLVAYIVAQGVADNGKEKAKLDKTNMAESREIVAQMKADLGDSLAPEWSALDKTIAEMKNS